MNNSKKVFIVGGNASIAKMFMEAGWETTSIPIESSLMCFTGGEDVSPHLYGEVAHPKTYSNYERDKMEQDYFNIALDCKIPMVGICRGGQFLNVMNGGKLHQHIPQHCCGQHKAFDFEGNEYTVTSTHHQIIIPNEKGIVLLIADVVGRKEVDEVEAVVYEETKCLCFQPHPEFYPGDTRDSFFHFLSIIHSR